MSSQLSWLYISFHTAYLLEALLSASLSAMRAGYSWNSRLVIYLLTRADISLSVVSCIGQNCCRWHDLHNWELTGGGLLWGEGVPGDASTNFIIRWRSFTLKTSFIFSQTGATAPIRVLTASAVQTESCIRMTDLAFRNVCNDADLTS